MLLCEALRNETPKGIESDRLATSEREPYGRSLGTTFVDFPEYALPGAQGPRSGAPPRCSVAQNDQALNRLAASTVRPSGISATRAKA